MDIKEIFFINLHRKDSLGMGFKAYYKASWCQRQHWHH